MKPVISHLFQDNNGRWHIQTNENHLNGVAELASSFADSIHLKEFGYAMGILHDKGKESNQFQSYIRTVSGYDPQRNAPYRVGHAYVGAVLAKKCLGSISDVITNQIAGHHRGLYDNCDLKPELDLNIPEGVDTNVPESLLSPQCFSVIKGLSSNDFHHICFSFSPIFSLRFPKSPGCHLNKSSIVTTEFAVSDHVFFARP